MSETNAFTQASAAFLNLSDDSETEADQNWSVGHVKIYLKKGSQMAFDCTAFSKKRDRAIIDLYNPEILVSSKKTTKKKTKSKKTKKREWTSDDSEDPDVSDMADEDGHCLFGCSECGYAWSGCEECLAEEPLVRRPKIEWNPRRPHDQPGIPCGPIYYPTEEEFADPFAFVAKIRGEAEKYGICMIVPPSSWKRPSDPFSRTTEDYEFYPKRQLVTSLCQRSAEAEEATSTESDDEFGFTTSDMPFTFKSFKAFAEWSHRLHFNLQKGQKGPPTDKIEGEFWRLVERDDDTEFETFYGSDLDASMFPSAFHQVNSDQIDQKADWNVSTWPRSTDSVLKYLPGSELINGVMVPWVYFGSSLSAFCWHIEDHALYSVNYLHKGASKIWYGVPSSRSADFEAAMADAFPALFKNDPSLLHRLVTHLSPVELKRRGVPVYRIEHKPGSFVITFPRGYHGGFNCGWNCAEAVNFAPPDWLPYGSDIINRYRSLRRPTTFSHDCLLIRIVSTLEGEGVDPLAVKFAVGELKVRQKEEAKRKTKAIKIGISKEQRMSGGRGCMRDGVWTDSADKDCEVCKCDLYLSAVVSPSKPGTCVCPEHANYFSADRIFIYRFTPSEIDKLIDEARLKFPDSDQYIKRALKRSHRTCKNSTTTFIRQGPFRRHRL